jgi:alkylation response protein AidB-like acyl-CoA dehydrogenase
MALIQFNNEQKMIENEVKKFAHSELEPIASEIDKRGLFPADIVKKLSSLGLSSLIVPEKYGGAGLDTTCLCIAVEELAAASASVSLIFAVNNSLVAYPIMKFGSEEIKEQYLKRLSDGEIGGYAVETGYEVNTPQQTQEQKNWSFRFVLNGEKANFMILPVNTEEGKSFYVYDRDEKDGLSKHRILGMRAAGIIGFDAKTRIFIKERLLIEPSSLKKISYDIQSYSDIIFSAMSLGIAEAAYNAALEYSKERRQFGRSICDFPMVQEMLVDMRTKIAASKLLVFNAAAQMDAGLKHSLNAHIARLFTSDAAVSCGLNAIQVLGGYGYTKEYPVERYMRDAKTIQLINATPVDLTATCAKELL